MSEENPYEPPDTQLEKKTAPRNAGWWKAFFWLTVVLMVLSAAALPAMPDLGAFDYFDFLLSVVTSVGLFGFAFHKPVGGVVFWRYFFYVALVESIFFSLVLPIASVPVYGQVISIDAFYVIGLAFTIALLWAIYQYAYKCSFLWPRA